MGANTLARIPVSTCPLVARDIFNCVRLKQNNVENYQYDSFCRLDDSFEAFAADTNYVARVKYLKICIWDSRDSESANTVLGSMRELTSLNVDVREIGAEANINALELVFSALSIDRELSWLRNLRLDGIDLDRYTYIRLPGAPNLKHLHLAYCSSYGPFLQMLTALSLDLAALTIEEADNGSGSFDNYANDFIRSLRSPERVSLVLDADFEQLHGLLDWSALHKCASVIKSLKLQYRCVLPPYPSDENLSDFRHFCKNASSLEQLSMSGIDLPMNKDLDDLYMHGSLQQFLVIFHLSLLLEGVID